MCNIPLTVELKKNSVGNPAHNLLSPDPKKV